jgi:hypothetical protein
VTSDRPESRTMASDPLREPQLRSLQRELVAAQDDKVARVLSMIDELAVRGDADRLIAPLRGRLAQLRPRRRLNLTRLLFTPLDPLIINACDWNAAAPAIPRTVLEPLTKQVQQGLGMAATIISAVAAEHARSDAISVLVAIGVDLWPRAAEILASASAPPDWVEVTGLRAQDHASLTAAISALLAQALPLLQIIARAEAGAAPEADDLRALLEAVAPLGGQALAMMIAMAMGWLPRSARLIAVADEFTRRQDNPALRATTDRAVEFVLSVIEKSPLPSPDLATAAQEATRVAAILDDLDTCSTQRPTRRERVERARRDVNAACRERFAQEVETNLLAQSTDIAAAGDDKVCSLEAAARDLRRFETAARRIGSAEEYDRRLQRAAEALRPQPGEDPSTRISRVRLVEILRGPEAGMAMLEADPA